MAQAGGPVPNLHLLTDKAVKTISIQVSHKKVDLETSASTGRSLEKQVIMSLQSVHSLCFTTNAGTSIGSR